MGAKIPSKNTTVFIVKQANDTTEAAPAGTDAVPAVVITPEPERTFDEQQLLGDSLSRDLIVTKTDEYGKIVIETFAQVLGALNPSLPIASVPLSALMQCIGFNIVVGGTGIITLTNDVVVNTWNSVQVRKHSDDFSAGTQKLYKVTNARGTMDVAVKVGSRTKYTYNLVGTYNAPTMQTQLVANYGNQILNFAPPLTEVNTIQVRIQKLTSLIPYVLSGVGADTVDLCLSEATIPNITGFDLQRFQLSCQSNFAKTTTNPDITLTILEDSAASGVFIPEDHILDYYKIDIKYGGVAGKQIAFSFRAAQLTALPTTEVVQFYGQQLTFKNVSTSSIIMS